jgi:hypothetical protein
MKISVASGHFEPENLKEVLLFNFVKVNHYIKKQQLDIPLSDELCFAFDG